KELLKGCLDRLGAHPSIIKDLTGKIIAFGQSVSGIPVDDEVIKGAMSCYVFEHMEIASYKILISAAKAIGDVETQRVCELILAQEVAMAEWLGNNLEELTFNYLSRAGDTMKEAKRYLRVKLTMQFKAATAAPFGSIHGGVSFFNQGCGRLAVIRKKRNTHTD